MVNDRLSWKERSNAVEDTERMWNVADDISKLY